MKLFTLTVLCIVFSLNKTVAQNREFSLQIGQGHAADSTKVFLTLSKDQKPLVAFNADLNKEAPRLDLTIKDTTGTIKLQSLLYVINEHLVQWQVSDQAHPGRPSEVKGEIRLFKRVQ